MLACMWFYVPEGTPDYWVKTELEKTGLSNETDREACV